MGNEPSARATVATPGYFESLGIALREGRLFARSDDAGTVPVALINQSMARRYWPGESPVGKKVTVRFAGPPVTREIVGVVADTRHEGLDDEPRPGLFVPHAQAPTGSITFTIRTAGDPTTLLPAVRRAIGEITRTIPLSSTATLDELLEASLKPRRFNLVLLACFALTALALAGVGIYGVMSQVTGERRQEIGIRLALGATSKDVLTLVMGQGNALALAGVALGIATATVLTRLLRGMLYGVAPLDPVTYVAVPALVVAIAALACYLPARRATRIDPMMALRSE